MTKTVIKIEDISKQYRIGQIGTGTLAHDFNRWWHKIQGKENPYLLIGEENVHKTKGKSGYVWALKNISFEVNGGESLGIIGKNGAGKSTLLKILSRVTEPTTGSFKVKGRIASLLEVGTGFHPEMTGRENIFMNGAILGMTRHEIKRKFDEIVAFSGIERYIDTPAKRYSSGMYVRLAFAVAAHLDSEILIADEVLAVGDAEFQKKCLGKMKSMSGQGRTVLFVSHNLAAIKSLCTTAVVIEHGKTKFAGDTTNAVSYYLKGDSETQNKKTFGEEYDRKEFTLHEICLNNVYKTSDEPLSENEAIELHTAITIKDATTERYHITYHIHNELGEPLFSFSHAKASVSLRQGKNNLVCTFPDNFFQPGTFYLSLFVIVDKRSAIFIEKDIISFTVVDGGREMGVYMGREPGFINPNFLWENKI